MFARVKKSLPKIIVFILLSIVLISLYGWILYSPFLDGTVLGIYPIATAYSSVFGVLAVLLLWGIFFRLPIYFYGIVFVILCALISILKKRAVLKTIGAILVTTPVILVLFLPSLISCNTIQSLTIERWNKTYHTAYSSVIVDDNYGELLLFECDQTGIFCTQIHSHYDSFMIRDSARLNYQKNNDTLKLTIDDRQVFSLHSR